MTTIADAHQTIIECAKLLNTALPGLGFVLIVFNDDPEGAIAYESNRPLKAAMAEVCNITRAYVDGGLQDSPTGSRDIPSEF